MEMVLFQAEPDLIPVLPEEFRNRYSVSDFRASDSAPSDAPFVLILTQNFFLQIADSLKNRSVPAGILLCMQKSETLHSSAEALINDVGLNLMFAFAYTDEEQNVFNRNLGNAAVSFGKFFRLYRNYQTDEDVIRSAGCAIITADRNQNVTKLNSLAASWISPDVLNKPTDINNILFIKENHESSEIVKIEKGSALSRESYAGEGTLLSRYGFEIPVEFFISPAGDGTAVSFNDITRRHTAEKIYRKLYKDMSRIRSAIDLHSVVAVTDPHGIIRHVNDMFCRISGFSAEELLGKTHRIVNSGYHPPEFFEEMWKTISSGNVWQGLICNRSKSGRLYWVETTIMPIIGEDGAPAEYIAIRTDITALKEIQSDLERARALAEAANKAKNLFLATMTHELRTPLNSIIGFSRLLSSGLTQEDTAEYSGYIRNSADHLLKLINDILDLSKIDAGSMHFDFRPLRISLLIMDTVNLVSASMKEKSIHSEILIEPDCEDLIIPGDEKRLRQVLLNLLSNAVKFTPEKGTITVSLGREKSEGLEGIAIKTADNGIGIPEDKIDYIFQNFTQADSESNRAASGTGLGLAIARRITEAHQGHISVNSRLNEGSVFTVWLPVSQE